MFLSFSLRNSRDVLPKEEERLKELVGYYAKTADGDWLNKMGYRDYKIKWCDAMKDTDGVMGAFVPWLYGKTVFLLPSENPPIAGMEDPWLSLIASILVHELRHAWQFKRHPVGYVCCALPILREFT